MLQPILTRVLETPALRPASIRTLSEPSLARCMLGSECNGGRCNLNVGLGTGETAQPNQGSRAVARNTALLERKVRYAAGISASRVFLSGSFTFPRFYK